MEKPTVKGFNDKSAKVDLLGVENQIVGLSDFISSCVTPITISIQGEWGAGKTSIMKMVEKRLTDNSNDKVKCIWFNTWQYSQFNLGNTLPISMMISLLSDINPKGNDKISKAIDGVKAFGKKMIKIATDSTFGSEAASTVEKVLEKGEVSDYVKELYELKEKIQEAINTYADKEDKRVVFFIDDLDRLAPDKAVELLEVLKIFMNCDRCVFVLAVDYSVVCTGVNMKYGNTIGSKKGKDFFDKIIQVPFKMPVARYDVKNYIKQLFSEINSNYISDSDISLFQELISSSVGVNPRTVKRLFNSYLLEMMIEKDAVTSDAEMRILFAMLCMQLADGSEPIYDYIVQNISSMKYQTINLIVGGNYEQLPDEIKAALYDYQRNTNFIIDKTEAMRVAKESYEELSSFWSTFCVAVDSGSDGTKISQKSYKTIINLMKKMTAQENGPEGEEIEFKVYKASEETKKVIGDFTASFSSNDELIQWAKQKEVKWAEHEHKGINVMRVKMAMQKAYDDGDLILDK